MAVDGGLVRLWGEASQVLGAERLALTGLASTDVDAQVSTLDTYCGAGEERKTLLYDSLGTILAVTTAGGQRQSTIRIRLWRESYRPSRGEAKYPPAFGLSPGGGQQPGPSPGRSLRPFGKLFVSSIPKWPSIGSPPWTRWCPPRSRPGVSP